VQWPSPPRQPQHGPADYAEFVTCDQTIEEIFGWVKTIGGGRKLRYIGLERNQFWAELTTATYNLVRMIRIEAVSRVIAEPAAA
jgi:hypothetical protein